MDELCREEEGRPITALTWPVCREEEGRKVVMQACPYKAITNRGVREEEGRKAERMMALQEQRRNKGE